MSEWISVKERLPEDMRDVLTYRGKIGGISIESYDPDERDWLFDYSIDNRVTHWMPLPEDPHDE